ncbi:hypothetical protein HYALB_00007140 [Hymenoscyphus albidus]|uniref:Nucleolar protein 9 n=1 Tax=Hymenoscyphus albidus TaxID=595503 RepID=A0A9N9LGP9_9HELO|nr:hypothetical protein HYALB_00007140 [Hymenoscyphus albidus]
MPKENKHSRGRRKGEKDKKRKRDTGDEEIVLPKRQKSQDLEDPSDGVQFMRLGIDDSILPQDDEKAPATERPFYGMLEDEEQEYFRRADELLELNDFPSDEERTLFLESVYKEAEGKELKIACSQSCSRLMERLILLSTSAQKKKLFGVFAGNFAHLVQHRFASHCAEMLFIQSAPVVTRELTGDEEVAERKEKAEGDADDTEDPESLSMESLFLATLDELEGQMTFLLTDRFASHTLRVLLVILSGRSLEKSSTNSLLQSKKKEKVVVANMAAAPTELSLNKRAVPESFQFAVEKIISDTIAMMDPTFIQVLATHPTGNPSLQLLLELELTNPNSKKGKNSDQKTIISALLPDEVGEEGSAASVFINGIIYDAIGSRLLETICTHAPGKLFKQIYKTTFKERIAGLARNEISSYVVMKVLERISKEDLVDAVEQIAPQIMGLVERSRTVIIKTLMERCHARKAHASVEALTNAIASSYGSDPNTLVLKMACITNVDALIKATSTTSKPGEETPEVHEQTEKTGTVLRSKSKKATEQALKPTPQQTHGSLLAQSLLAIPGPPSTLIQSSLLCLPQPTLLALALYTPTSHIIQSALNPITPTLFRRKFINTLLFSTEPETPELDPTLILALSTTGSHTLDALLKSTASTAPLFILCERVLLTLCNHEVALRENFTGRIIWRNYHLDLFKRRRGEWVNTVKALGAAAYPSPEPVKNAEVVEATPSTKTQLKNKKKNNNRDKKQPWKGNDDEFDANGNKKSKIQLARERHAKNKATGGTPGNANNIKIGSSRVGAAKSGEKEKGIEDMVHPARRVAV